MCAKTDSHTLYLHYYFTEVQRMGVNRWLSGAQLECMPEPILVQYTVTIILHKPNIWAWTDESVVVAITQ